MDWTIIVAALIAAIFSGGGVAAYFEYRIKHKELTADTKARSRLADLDGWVRLNEQLSLRINILTERVTLLESQVAARDTRIRELVGRVDLLESRVVARDIRIDDLEQEIDELRDWIMKQGLTPPPRHRKRNS